MDNYVLKDGICYQIIFRAWSKAKKIFPIKGKSLRWEKEVECHFCGSCDDQVI